MTRAGEELREAAARSDREARDTRARLTRTMAPLERAKLECLLSICEARARLLGRCAEAADRCGSVTAEHPISGSLELKQMRPAALVTPSGLCRP